MFPLHRPQRSLHLDRAFTVAELMLFSAILIVLSSIAFKSMYSLDAERKLRTASIELSGYLDVARNVALAENSPCTIAILQPTGGVFGPDPSQTTNSCRSGTIARSLDLRLVSGDDKVSVAVMANSGVFPLTFTPEGAIREGATVLISSSEVRAGSWCVEVQAPLATVRRGWRATGSNACNYAIER